MYSFLETSVPLLVLIEAAHSGDEKEVEECALVFTEHANKLVEVRKIFKIIKFTYYGLILLIWFSGC